MKEREYHISKCCEADIFFKGISKGFWCQKCKKEITRTIVGFTQKEIKLMEKIAKKNNPKHLTKYERKRV